MHKAAFNEVQQQFMDHIRDPEKYAAPSDIEQRRMAIYRDLFFNNIEGFVSSAFPVLKTLYSDNRWHALIREFFSVHDCKSPYFLDIASEFLGFLSTEYTQKENDPVFLLELAHYEWIELDVSVCHSDPYEQPLNMTEITSQPLYLSSCARNLSYHFAVHTISVDNQPLTPAAEPYYFVVYRDNADEVQFLATNAMTALLLSFIADAPDIRFSDLCQLLSERATHFTAQQITQGALTTLTAMAERGILVTKKPPSHL